MRRNGSVLVVLLLASVIVTVLGTSLLTVGYHARARATRTADDMAARVAADAGLTKAIHTLCSQFDAGTLDPAALPGEVDADLPNFEGTFTYTSAADPSGGYTITSVGTFHNAHRTVEGTLKSRAMIHRFAVLALQELTLRNSARVDWYNNQPGDDPLQIGTNSTQASAIMLDNNSYINGDVVVGAGGNPGTVIINNGGTYTGSASTQARSYEAPAVSVPSPLAASASNGQIDDTTTISASGKYTKINLGTGQRLTVNGAVELYLTGDITLGNSAEIRVTAGSSLVLYVDGNVTADNGSTFDNQTNDAARFKLLGTSTCSAVTLKNSGNLYGVIYAPQAALTVHNSATVRGSVTARTCELKDDATLYYDAALQDQADTALVGPLEQAGWREY